MLTHILKVFISACIIVIVSEISKKNATMGGLIASIPLISILSMIWLYLDTNDIGKVKQLSNGILWMTFPSLSLFLTLPIFINLGIKFYLSLFISIIITFIFYGLTLFSIDYFEIKI
tara:strand:- start:163 stop:513 length:351 start_codon:yes stop_codon:yes gene_type:complete